MPDNRVEKIMQRLQIMSHNFHDDKKTSARNYIKYEITIIENRAVSNMKVISTVICTLVILVHHYNAEETVSTGCQLL